MANKPVTEGICATGRTGCAPFDCRDHGLCETVTTYEKKNFKHEIATDYTVSFLSGNTNFSIPMAKTTRVCSAEWSIRRDPPILTNGQYYYGEWLPVRCLVHEPDQHECTFKEDCEIEKSTIHYIDHRYGVCLYKYQKDTLKIDSEQRNNEQALFRAQHGPFHRVRVMTGDFAQTRKIEWRLIVNGVQTVVDSIDIEPSFIAGAYAEGGGASQWFPNYKRPAGIHLILIFPFPGSYGIAQSDLECGTPFYDYAHEPGEDPELASLDGGKDMFYPEWCRNMQEDPIWREAADRRWNAKWWHVPEDKNRRWAPPPLTVDPIPRGSYAKHPKVGELYQFLVDSYGNDPMAKAITSSDINEDIDAALAEGLATKDTTLYYPIGII